ncbi:hypothetical protein CHK_3217 [Christensenella hongkongensis]|uniref:Uncharacterized protein n=1 Tax=Christensenella hongkongensis TaxID=270498 RepID=A0A0M2NGF3_9FIRM|nr:hypothetical protein CHK_3217 [Christensenella hongkongensis]
MIVTFALRQKIKQIIYDFSYPDSVRILPLHCFMLQCSFIYNQ